MENFPPLMLLLTLYAICKVRDIELKIYGLTRSEIRSAGRGVLFAVKNEVR